MKRTTALTITIATILAGVLTGCAPADDAESTAVMEKTAAAPAPATAPAPAPEDTAAWDSQLEAAAVAESTMTAFITTEQDPQSWWDAFSATLTADARQLWAYTDPRLVPATELTGPAAVTSAPSSTQVFVTVPTDAGDYALQLVRHVEPGAGQGPWQVQEIRPPETR